MLPLRSFFFVKIKSIMINVLRQNRIHETCFLGIRYQRGEDEDFVVVDSHVNLPFHTPTGYEHPILPPHTHDEHPLCAHTH